MNKLTVVEEKILKILLQKSEISVDTYTGDHTNGYVWINGEIVYHGTIKQN